MSLCCRRVCQDDPQVLQDDPQILQDDPQAIAPTTSINSKWYAAGIRTGCIVSGGVVGATASVLALLAIINRVPTKTRPSFTDCPSSNESFLCPIGEFVAFVSTYATLSGAVTGYFVANRILGKQHSA